MKGRRKGIREIGVEAKNQDEYKYRTQKDVFKMLKEMREILSRKTTRKSDHSIAREAMQVKNGKGR